MTRERNPYEQAELPEGVTLEEAIAADEQARDDHDNVRVDRERDRWVDDDGERKGWER